MDSGSSVVEDSLVDRKVVRDVQKKRRGKSGESSHPTDDQGLSGTII